MRVKDCFGVKLRLGVKRLFRLGAICAMSLDGSADTGGAIDDSTTVQLRLYAIQTRYLLDLFK